MLDARCASLIGSESAVLTVPRIDIVLDSAIQNPASRDLIAALTSLRSLLS